MDRYSSQLNDFNKAYNTKDITHELIQYKMYLTQLLNIQTVDELIVFYLTTKKSSFVFLDFEREITMIHDIGVLKAYLIEYFTSKLKERF